MTPEAETKQTVTTKTAMPQGTIMPPLIPQTMMPHTVPPQIVLVAAGANMLRVAKSAALMTMRHHYVTHV